MAHLSRGSQLCLLNIVLTSPPMSAAVEGLERADALIRAKANKQGGFAPSKVEMPSFRAPWVCKRIFDVEGKEVDITDKRHPCRSIEAGEVLAFDREEVAPSDSGDEFIADLS